MRRTELRHHLPILQGTFEAVESNPRLLQGKNREEAVPGDVAPLGGSH